MNKKFSEIEKILKDDGWFLHRTKGSHRQFRHPSKKGLVTVPFHGSGATLDHKIVKSIFKQAGLGD